MGRLRHEPETCRFLPDRGRHADNSAHGGYLSFDNAKDILMRLDMLGIKYKCDSEGSRLHYGSNKAFGYISDYVADSETNRTIRNTLNTDAALKTYLQECLKSRRR